MVTRKQETTRQAKRAASIQALHGLLAGNPKVDPAMVNTAVDALVDVANQYVASKPVIDKSGRRNKPNLSEARATLQALQKHLTRVQEQVSALPLEAMKAICDVTNAPLGKLHQEINHVCQVVEEAQAELKARPNKVADYERNVLAYRVAVVFRDILKVKPTSTKSTQLTPNSFTARGGAFYARVLDATLNVAGVANCDLGPLITAGLGMLKDPNLP